MKKIILVLSMFLVTFVTQSQSLNSNASYIKINYSEDYESSLKKHALNEWNDDYSMVLYEINKQADALVELIELFKTENTNIVFKAIEEWSIVGYKEKNKNRLQKIRVFELEQLVKLDCDWSMVKYEYLKQVKAKNSF